MTMTATAAMTLAMNPPVVTSLGSVIVSMEAQGAEQGQTTKEREYEVYGRVEDLQAMKEAATRFEYQEQWGMPCDFGKDVGIFGSIRVRMTRQGEGGPVYTQTIKAKADDGSDENEMEISVDTFNLFSRLVPNGLLKTRYFFPLEGTDYELEVDVFHDADGKQCNVVKIDLEVPEGVEVEEIKIPFKIAVTRIIKPGKKSSGDADYVKDLFVNHYEVQNPQHKKSA